MSRHRLDLLPLLDVFMVVLFVFATIQEERLDQSLRAADELARERDAATAAQAVSERERASAADAGELAAARERIAALEAELARTRADAREVIAKLPDGPEAVRRQGVLDKLLDRYSVFEIEIAGAIAADGTVVNHCCFRTDPTGDAWRSCGELPAEPSARELWWTEGGGGLEPALRKTKGGNAMTVIRQDERASYRIAARLETLLRERLPDHQIYDDGVAPLEIRCPAAR